MIAAGELLWFNTASTLNAEAPAYYSVLQKPTGEEARALAILEQELASRHQEGARPRVEVVGVSGSWQNLSVVRGLEATNGYNPLRLGSYDRLVSPGETTHIVDQRLFPASFSGYDCALARELGLEYLVLGRPIEEVPHLARRPVAEVLLGGPKVWIYRLRGAEPRVKFISRIVVADTDAQTKAGTVCRRSDLGYGHRRRRAEAAALLLADQRRARAEPGAHHLLASGSRAGGGARAPIRACSSCTRPIIRAGSPRWTASRPASCAPTCCSAASRWATGATSSSSASSRSRSPTCARRRWGWWSDT